MVLIDLQVAWPDELEQVLVLTVHGQFRLSFWRQTDRGREWLHGLDVIGWQELPRIPSRLSDRLPTTVTVAGEVNAPALESELVGNGTYIRVGDNMMFPNPVSDEVANVEWRLRHSQEAYSDGTRYLAASIISAYRTLVASKTTEARTACCDAIRKAYKGNDTERS